MSRINNKLTLFAHYIAQFSRLTENQQRQKLLKSLRKKLTVLLLSASSNTFWFIVGHSAATATNIEVQSKDLSLPFLITQSIVKEETPGTPRTGDSSELSPLPRQKAEKQTPQPAGDAELGTLRVQQQELKSPQATPATVHLLGQVGYFQTNNIFSAIDPVGDGLLSAGLTLWAAPKLGAKTSVVTAIDGRLIRYVDRTEFDYNQLRLRVGIRQQLTPRMYGEIGWNNQQLFNAKVGDRLLSENSLRLALQRQDRITDKLWLNSFYEFRLSFADPENRSRIINSLSTSLNYYIHPRLQVGLEYQFASSDFTQRQREDEYNLILSHLTYAPSRDSQINVQAGFSLGGSSDPTIDFNNIFFSVNYTVELGKF